MQYCIERHFRRKWTKRRFRKVFKGAAIRQVAATYFALPHPINKKRSTLFECSRFSFRIRRGWGHSPTSLLIYASSFVYSFSDYTSYSFSSSGLRFKRKLVHHFRFRSRGALPPPPQIQNGSTQIGVFPFCIGGGDGT